MRAQKFDWSKMPSEPVRAGFFRQMAIGQNKMICRHRMQPGWTAKEHSHIHEQMAHLFQGRLRFVVDGETIDLEPGQTLLIPSGVPHSVEVSGDEEVVVFDIFSPLREDLIHPKG